MKITTEQELRSFEFWGGAREKAALLTCRELDAIERQLNELFPDGFEDVELNELFADDDVFIAELVGYETFDEIIEERC